jgi:hypothetical protein
MNLSRSGQRRPDTGWLARCDDPPTTRPCIGACRRYRAHGIEITVGRDSTAILFVDCALDRDQRIRRCRPRNSRVTNIEVLTPGLRAAMLVSVIAGVTGPAVVIRPAVLQSFVG